MDAARDKGRGLTPQPRPSLRPKGAAFALEPMKASDERRADNFRPSLMTPLIN